MATTTNITRFRYCSLARSHVAQEIVFARTFIKAPAGIESQQRRLRPGMSVGLIVVH